MTSLIFCCWKVIPFYFRNALLVIFHIPEAISIVYYSYRPYLKIIGLLLLVLQIGPNDVANFLLFCFGNTTYVIWHDLTGVGHPWRLFGFDDQPAEP